MLFWQAVESGERDPGDVPLALVNREFRHVGCPPSAPNSCIPHVLYGGITDATGSSSVGRKPVATASLPSLIEERCSLVRRSRKSSAVMASSTSTAWISSASGTPGAISCARFGSRNNSHKAFRSGRHRKGPAMAGLTREGRWVLGRQGREGRRAFAAAVERNVLGPGAAHISAEVAELVEHGLGEGAMGGELAAIKGDEAAGAVGDAGERGAPGEPARLPPAMSCKARTPAKLHTTSSSLTGPLPAQSSGYRRRADRPAPAAEQARVPASPSCGTSVVPTIRKRRSSQGSTKITRSSSSCKV